MSLKATTIAYATKTDTALAKLTFIYIADFANDDGVADAHLPGIMEFTGCTKGEATDAMRELTRIGAIAPANKKDGGLILIVGAAQ